MFPVFRLLLPCSEHSVLQDNTQTLLQTNLASPAAIAAGAGNAEAFLAAHLLT